MKFAAFFKKHRQPQRLIAVVGPWTEFLRWIREQMVKGRVGYQAPGGSWIIDGTRYISASQQHHVRGMELDGYFVVGPHSRETDAIVRLCDRIVQKSFEKKGSNTFMEEHNV